MPNTIETKVSDANETFASMDASWWDSENLNKDRRYFTLKSMFDSVRYQLSEGEGRKAADIGAGKGRYSMLLCSLGYDVSSVDINQEMLDIMEQRGIPSKKYHADAEHLPFEDEYFDVVTAMDITMHVQRTETLLEELYRIMKPDAELFTNISNANSMYGVWTTRVNPVFKKMQADYLRKTFKPKEFKTLLEAAGFRVVEEHGHGVVSPLSMLPGWKEMIVPVNLARYMSKNLGLDSLLGAKYGHVIDYHVKKYQ